MYKELLSKNIHFLKSLIGKKIVLVRRQLFEDDLNLDDYEQSADGPIELTFNDKMVVHFEALTEPLSVGIVVGEMPKYGESYKPFDLTNNKFWKDKIDQSIIRLTLLKSLEWTKTYPCEFGIEIIFENGEKIFITYISEDEHQFDAIRVTDHYSKKSCIAQTI